MRKSPEEKAETRARGFASADRVQWERLIKNPELIAEIHKLQGRYGLPLSSNRKVMDWMDWYEPIEINKSTGELIFGEHGKRRERLRHEVKELAQRFRIPREFYDSLHSMVIRETKYLNYMSMGFPEFRHFRAESGEWRHEWIITPTTDLGNPLVLKVIRDWQAKYWDMPPQPQLTMGSKKLDWRPVREWEARHPDVTRKQIAKMLSRDYTDVKKRLEALDKEFEN